MNLGKELACSTKKAGNAIVQMDWRKSPVGFRSRNSREKAQKLRRDKTESFLRLWRFFAAIH
jgi:hypothetical protein